MDPELKAAKRRGFLTDISLVGRSDHRVGRHGRKAVAGLAGGRRAAARFSDTVASALPAGLSAGDTDLADRVGARLQEGLTVGAERGRELAAVAAERAEPLLEAARDAARPPPSGPHRCWRRPGTAGPKSPTPHSSRVTSWPPRHANGFGPGGVTESGVFEPGCGTVGHGRFEHASFTVIRSRIDDNG